MKECNECSNTACNLIDGKWPKLRDNLPKKMQGHGHESCYAHKPLPDISKGLGYLGDNVAPEVWKWRSKR